ncbi:MAG: NUDIX domain-containing protein [Candidatus Staskawiczbacteria bacterium]
MIKEEQSCGVILVKKGNPDYFLILKQVDGYWSFPKGHVEENETIQMTAFRELKEETGIQDLELLNFPPIIEEYNFKQEWENIHKTVFYLIGIAKSDFVKIQESKIIEYKWAMYDEAIEKLVFENKKKVLEKAKKYLETL